MLFFVPELEVIKIRLIEKVRFAAEPDRLVFVKRHVEDGPAEREQQGQRDKEDAPADGPGRQ